MGLYLIAAAWELPLVVVIIEVAIGLGMVIFVHELGHFAVAKMCGVKCEKFYLGFDIYGLKLLKFTRGETEYGIGILPLGGYVKMLGQEDNPARLQEEIERAKHLQPEDAQNDAEADQPDQPKHTGEEQIDLKAAEAALYDPRSYLAQSVPKRMAIISAGVIMNVVFAFLMAVVAFWLGVRQVACGVGMVLPGEAAWKADLRVGDGFEQIGEEKVEQFRDLQKNIAIGDIDDGVEMLIRRAGVAKPFWRKVHPDRTRLVPTIGIGGPYSAMLSERGKPVAAGSPAALAVAQLEGGKETAFEGGDKFVKIDDKPINGYADIHACLALHPDETLEITVERPAKTDGKGTQTAREIVFKVAPNPMRRLGLVMEMGEICAIQAGSPAADAEIISGDKIIGIDFDPPEEPDAAGNPEPPGDPMTLPDRLRKLAGKKIRLYIQRNREQLGPIPVGLRKADWYETPLADGNPMTTASLGIAYRVLNRVEKLVPGSPAGKAASIRPGDKIVEARLIPPDDETLRRYDSDQKEITIEFDETQQNWPALVYAIQQLLPQTRVELTWSTGAEQHTATFSLEPAADWFNPDRGFRFEPESFIRVARSLGDAVKLGGGETLEALTMVVQFLRKIGTQISPKAFGGPGAIATAAGRAAQGGIAKLLIFLCMLSANLAVINFLPIPLLDGGHMVLLVWEGIRGKPADERVQVVLTYIGLVFILGLMAWVIALDVGLIPRF